ncbi:hypothetical protein B0T25DRAFT_113099 [Lasiosphaeria hispida]|uniref:Methyltransferase type 11 domain-containing protein n=1 Tax=Lasiosphaeria hispida TaxID=260671 RepID=A0AAJ0HRB7_9PEZI|nr:hypothetical protein B0T25DRAFT_113099 [Lasiosphaeria hispida]
MASQRSGSRGPAWSGDARHKDHRASIIEPPREELSLDLSWKAKRAAGISRQPVRTIPQPRMSSRLPQSQPYRRPSTGDVEKPRLNHQPQSWDSAVSGSSGISGSNEPTSPATNSRKLPGPSSKQRNVLRRKQSGLSQDITNTRNDSQNDSNRTSSSLSDPRLQTPLDAPAALHFDRDLAQSPMEIRVAQQVEVAKTTPHAVTIYPELDRYRELMPFAQVDSPSMEMPYKIAPYDLPPPTPLFSCTSSQISGFSGSPSTRFSGSPGPGPYSRDTTPTSISSQSPGLVAPIRIPTTGSRMRQVDPALTRPPITRRRTDSISNEVDTVSADPHGLAAVRESLTSSSSNSTVRDGDRKDKKKKRLSPLPPSPPPRKSSQKFKKSRDEDESPSKSSRQPAQPLMASPSRAKATSYSLPRSTVPAQSVAAPKNTPPVRPSRDGTPDLHSQLGMPIPIIQSNLSSTSLSERRQSNYLASAPVGRPIFSSSLPEKQSYLSRRPVGREATPTPKSTPLGGGMDTSKPDAGRTARTPSPSVSTFKSRFPIFGRRTKAVPEAVQQDSRDKSARKGPAAGTGHEGYGRLGSVRRKSSTIANTARANPGTMSSQESLDNSRSYDPFLAERMAPVVIAGGEIIENRNTSSELSRTESNQSFTLGRPSVESKSSSQVSLSSRETPRHTLWPSPFPRNSSQAPSLSSRRPSDSSDSEALAMKSTLAFRRSVQRVQSGEQDPLRIPRPIVTRSQAISSSITSLDASIISDDSLFDPSAEATRVSRELASTAILSGPKKLLKRARSPRKWNFFGRSQSQPPTETKNDTSKTVAATVKVVQAKPVAFYTLMDSSEQEDADTPDLEEVLREARSLVTPPENIRAVSLEERRPSVAQDFVAEEPVALRAAGRQLPTAAKHTIAPPHKVTGSLAPRTRLSITPALLPVQQQQQPTVRQASGRPSRLPQVGRIPKVVSARAEQTSPKSFSRPFHRLSAQAPLLRPDIQDPNFVAKGPTPPKPSTPELIQDESATTSGTNISTIHVLPGESPLEHGSSMHEFLSFSPRKNSQCTTTSSSSSGGLLTFAAATAVVPAPNAPLAEDEIWDEYNDLLGDETSRPPRSEGSSRKPSRLNVNKSGSERIVEPSLESPTLSPPPVQSFGQALYPGNEHPASSIYSVDMVEQIKQALDIDPAPASRSSGPGISLGFDGENYGADSGRQAEQVQRDSKIPEHQARRSDASGSSQSSDNSPLSQVNLRVGSMTVSKWLTFGHVLFSPVRDELVSEVGSLKRPSILVVDGLGNDDWSFYAAETYPAATFFNLSPRAPLPADRRSSSAFPLSPPNHHQIQYLSHGDKFPFGPQSFTSVVFRFPAAVPESQYRNIVSEARRVLKPGGYIELSILDVDLNNMGNRGRRSVRRLKEHIHSSSPEICLGSTSDLMLRLLGRKGFTDIKTCRVGVPVASPVPRSSGSGAGASSGKRASTEARSGRGTSRPRKDNRSLPELISDESPVADESITKMVAKVGRWWYTRCYESAAVSAPGPTARTAMWNDKALLAECEEWGTSLKLMVCHARVPDGRARVASI